MERGAGEAIPAQRLIAAVSTTTSVKPSAGIVPCPI